MKRTSYGVVSGAILVIILVAIFEYAHHPKLLTPTEPPALTVPFDESMQLAQFPDIPHRPDFSYVYGRLKDLYEKNNNFTPSAAYRIPHIIHIMWLGGKLPEEYTRYVQSWAHYHPEWTILFWTDNARNYDQGTQVVHSFDALEQLLQHQPRSARIVVDAAQLVFDNRGFYDAARNYGEKSDILKWEIVYRFGGVYVDTDFECLRSLDIYHRTYDFYTGIQPLDTNRIQLGAALYGAIPHHPILKLCVDSIKYNQHIERIVDKTGPIHFTRCFLALMEKTGLRDIALPASYFYPCGYEQRGTDPEVWCKAESYAVHHWAGSWLKPEAFVRS